jgi:hypothetical protein
MFEKNKISMMKNLLFSSKLLFLVGLMLVSVNMAAATRAYGGAFARNNTSSVNHFLTVGLSAGYSTLIDSYDDLSTQGGMGGFLGIGYEMRINHFYWSLGAEMQLLNATADWNLGVQDQHCLDTQEKPMIMHYEFDPITEYQRLMYMQIPIMLGFYQRGFYFGAGVKIGIPIVASATQLSSYKTSGTYNEYVDDFSGIPNHGYDSYKLDQAEDLTSHIKVSLAAEIGYDVLASVRRTKEGMRHGLRIAAVCEYGLTNVLGAQKDSKMFEVNPKDATQVSVKPFYETQSLTGNFVNSLYAGIKFTWICDFSRIPCDCDE